MKQCKRERTRYLMTRRGDRIANLFGVLERIVGDDAPCGVNWRLREQEAMATLIEAHERFCAASAPRA